MFDQEAPPHGVRRRQRRRSAMTHDDDTPKAGTAAPTTVGARDDGPRKPAGPAPKDARRETEARLAEAMGGKAQRKAREGLKEEPGLTEPGKAAAGEGG